MSLLCVWDCSSTEHCTIELVVAQLKNNMIVKEYDAEDNIIIAHLSDTISKQELLDYYGELEASKLRQVRRFALVYICSAISLDFKSQEILDLREQITPLPGENVRHFIAVVTCDPVGTAYGHAFKAYISNPKYTVELFQDEKASRDWLKQMQRIG